MPDQKLAIRDDSGSCAQPYEDGALSAIRKANTFLGLRRGLDTALSVILQLHSKTRRPILR
jgi:4-hydroxy-tetrahydrodipicolinate reductase